MKVLVVGGGISGLTTLHALVGRGHDVVCVEPERVPGGVMRSERHDGFLIERGPQGLLDGAPEVNALIDELGLRERVVRPSKQAKRRFVYVRGKLRAVPLSPPALLTSSLLSFGAKWRLARETRVPPRTGDDDESLTDFVARRLGPEVATALAAPFVIGIYAGDASRLSARSAFPRMVEAEAQHGSLLRGIKAARREGRGQGGLVSFREGLGELPVALAGRHAARLVNDRVARLERAGAGWRAVLAGGPHPTTFDAVVLATPTRVTAALLESHAPAAATELRSLRLASAAVVALGFKHAEVGMDLAGYGFLVARGEGPALLGCQYESSVFPGRAPEGSVLLRCIQGGVFHPELVDLPDDALVERTVADLRTIAGLNARPETVSIVRWKEAIPQYEIGHRDRVARIDAALAGTPRLHVSGNALRGISVPDAIKNALALAATVGAR